MLSYMIIIQDLFAVIFDTLMFVSTNIFNMDETSVKMNNKLIKEINIIILEVVVIYIFFVEE